MRKIYTIVAFCCLRPAFDRSEDNELIQIYHINPEGLGVKESEKKTGDKPETSNDDRNAASNLPPTDQLGAKLSLRKTIPLPESRQGATFPGQNKGKKRWLPMQLRLMGLSKLFEPPAPQSKFYDIVPEKI